MCRNTPVPDNSRRRPFHGFHCYPSSILIDIARGMPSHRPLLIVAYAALAAAVAFASKTHRPIIGILAQKVNDLLPPRQANQTYISASYVKFVEQAGARVIPIFVDQEDDYYIKTFNAVNGILFPGGDVDAVNSSYGRAASILYDLAMKANRKGTHFPLWGTCLGLELVARLAVGGKQVLTPCLAQGVGMPLDFTRDFRRSRMLHSLPRHLQTVLSSEPITYNAHHWCLTLENFKAFGLNKFYKILSTNVDLQGMTFISSMEGTSAPVYAVQFHPEMAVFEWGTRTPGRSHLYHNGDTALFSQYLANFFVGEARRNNHRFPNEDEERRALIYNYQPSFTEDKTYFTQMYLFE
ncbi:hypothetical protein V5799_004876 [Amblyomma americanum]|uniref:folate gamma-glutamyl hydrolase n=1 Tax=Amblyomma americanum TaxID=6943 RepID=A0AAQ4D4V4_AMBAM